MDELMEKKKGNLILKKKKDSFLHLSFRNASFGRGKKKKKKIEIIRRK